MGRGDRDGGDVGRGDRGGRVSKMGGDPRYDDDNSLSTHLIPLFISSAPCPMQVQQISSQISLRALQQDFGLVRADQPVGFPEWQVDLPRLTDLERSALSHIRQNFMYQLEWGQLSENLVKMVVLSPLLDLAGFYQSKLRVQDEAAVELAVADQEMLYRGKIDVLVCDERFWILVIEAKHAQFSLINAIPQCLAYMLASPNGEAPVYGLVTNGSNFRFIKLNNSRPPAYALSDELLFDRGDDFAHVLQVLKKLQVKGDKLIA